MPRTKVTTHYQPKLGSIVYFAREGTTVETVTVAKGTKPAGSNFSTWEPLGCVDAGTVNRLVEAGNQVVCFNATTGEDEIIKTPDSDAMTVLQFELTLNALSDFLWGLAFGADSVNGTTGAFVPGSLPGGAVQGWCVIQVQVGTEKVAVMHLWVELKISNAQSIRNRTANTQMQVTITQLRSALETGVLGTPE
jgi:hypothetical protein